MPAHELDELAEEMRATFASYSIEPAGSQRDSLDKRLRTAERTFFDGIFLNFRSQANGGFLPSGRGQSYAQGGEFAAKIIRAMLERKALESELHQVTAHRRRSVAHSVQCEVLSDVADIFFSAALALPQRSSVTSVKIPLRLNSFT